MSNGQYDVLAGYLAASQYAKYTISVHVITAKTLREAARGDNELLSGIEDWLEITRRMRWGSFVELKRSFPKADYVKPYVVFNILNNRFRLIAHVRYTRLKPNGALSQGRVYIRHLLTHQQYNDRNNWK